MTRSDVNLVTTSIDDATNFGPGYSSDCGDVTIERTYTVSQQTKPNSDVKRG